MKHQVTRTLRRICLPVGIGLLAAAAVVLGAWQWEVSAAEKKMGYVVQAIGALIPEPQSAAVEERRNNAMSVLSFEGTDFVGILEIPRYGSALPVCAKWGEVSKHPCCLSGSIYDGTMQIGGTSQRGQYDFYREISAGDAVFFTDMEGNRYAYSVTDIRYEKHADQAALQREEAGLVLFVKNVYAFEYVVIFCNIQGSR